MDKFLAPHRRVRTAPGPYPPGSSRSRVEGRNDDGSSRTPFRLAHRTRTIWQYWHVPALSGPLAALPSITRIELPSASPPCHDRTDDEGLAPSYGPSTPHGARLAREIFGCLAEDVAFQLQFPDPGLELLVLGF